MPFGNECKPTAWSCQVMNGGLFTIVEIIKASAAKVQTLNLAHHLRLSGDKGWHFMLIQMELQRKFHKIKECKAAWVMAKCVSSRIWVLDLTISSLASRVVSGLFITFDSFFRSTSTKYENKCLPQVLKDHEIEIIFKKPKPQVVFWVWDHFPKWAGTHTYYNIVYFPWTQFPYSALMKNMTLLMLDCELVVLPKKLVIWGCHTIAQR